MAEPKARQRKFAPRSRTGCLTCRARRKRCDSQHPTCANCERLNLTCEWQAPRRLALESSKDAGSSSPELQISLPVRPSLSPWDELPNDAVSERKHLLQYYIEAFVPSVSVATTPTSFYTSLYMPWALHVDGMLDAILAISSAQLARRTVNDDRAVKLREVSSKHQRRCYAFIKERLTPAGLPRDAYQVAAVILILVGLEALNGTKTTRWISQLQSVQRMLNQLSPEQSIVDCIEVDALHRHFTYHFAFASLMARVSRTLPTAGSQGDMSPITAGLMPTTVDPLMGINYQLCDLISRIQYVSSPNPDFPQINEDMFNSIENGIQSWVYDNPFSMGVDAPLALDLIALAESYRLAALIQLYRNSPAHSNLILACANRAMEFIIRIPPGSPAESSLLYPIFLAGAELDDEAAIDRCFKRLDDIQNRNRYENVGTVQKVLKEVWRAKLESGQRRDWEDILREWDWSFTVG